MQRLLKRATCCAAVCSESKPSVLEQGWKLPSPRRLKNRTKQNKQTNEGRNEQNKPNLQRSSESTVYKAPPHLPKLHRCSCLQERSGAPGMQWGCCLELPTLGTVSNPSKVTGLLRGALWGPFLWSAVSLMSY